MRETVAQLNEIFESQDRQIEILRSDVGVEGRRQSGGNARFGANSGKGTNYKVGRLTKRKDIWAKCILLC